MHNGLRKVKDGALHLLVGLLHREQQAMGAKQVKGLTKE
jgi:hypothetical protein